MTRDKCAGLVLIKNTLSPNRETVVCSMYRGPYGPIEDWDGEIVVEVTSMCVMNDEAQNVVAEILAANDIYRLVSVQEWTRDRIGQQIHLVPKVWEEIGTSYLRSV